ncbi:MAG: acetaldehyde dehydrogenase (acetylating) [Alphaproteobacteria bacterium]|nr:acetaldehyde dehydrogenase (acetylating) [Alphaproteobacteria bacterium]
MPGKTSCAIIGSGNIGADLMIKIINHSRTLQVTAVAGIDPQSEGLAMARARGIATTDKGIDGLAALPEFAAIKIVFDATSASAHARHAHVCNAAGKVIIDLTPAAIGPYVIPAVNGTAHRDAMNVNMVTCGGQATIPMVFAVNRVAKVHYGEIIASVASKSAGPGTRANIDEFTETTRHAVEVLGGAGRGKAIIILNPAEPPLIMRDTIFCLSADAAPEAISASVKAMVAQVQEYVPGYRLKQEVQFERFGANNPVRIPGYGEFSGIKSSIFLEVEGAGDYLPPYAGNLDIMTAAALRTAEGIAAHRFAGAPA